MASKFGDPLLLLGKICTSTPATPHVASNLSCNWLLPHQHPTHQPAWTSSLSQALPKALPKPGALPKVSWPWSSPSSLSDSNRGEGGAPRRTIRDGDRRARMPNTLTANVVKGNYTGPGDLLAKWRHCISSVFQFMYSLRLVCFIFPHSHPKDFWIACCHDRCGLRI